MKLLEVRLQNITCFENLFLDFRSEDSDEPAPWVVLLGENGTGKSTILQMIGAVLLHTSVFVIAGNVAWDTYKRDKSIPNEESITSLWLLSESGDANETQLPDHRPRFISRSLITVERSNTGHRYVGVSDGAFDSSDTFENLVRPPLTNGWFSCGYGSWRTIFRRSNSDNGPLPTLEHNAKPYRFATLFGDNTGFTNLTDLLASLYVKSIFPDHKPEDERRYETAERALLAALPQVKGLEITSDQQVLVEEHGRKIPLERLSDGYRGTLAWIGDLIRRLFDAYPNSDNPLHERGVVLVDEIDLHLHPTWQRSIVGDIRKLFPNLQFIVTTHSPFIAQGLQPQDKIIVLERNSKTGVVTAREDAGALESWSADQIYAEYFGLKKGTRGPKTQRRESRYERLLDAQARGELDGSGIEELSNLQKTMDQVKVGATPAEEAIFKAARTIASELENRLNAMEQANHQSEEDRAA
jgi:energy-coupling factor transporter ATP-binding protein EcfA2